MTPDGTGAATTVWVRLDRELWLFVAPHNRAGEIAVRHDGTASTGHVVEALGVPLTEVGELVVDGVRAGPSRRPRAGTTIEVRPVRRPQRVDSGAACRFV